MVEYCCPPCDADALLHLQSGFQRFPVDGRDLIDAQPGADEDERGLPVPVVVDGNLLQLVFVHICAVARDVDSQPGFAVLVRQVLDAPCCC